jgi:hypothetical protein
MIGPMWLMSFIYKKMGISFWGLRCEVSGFSDGVSG